MKILVPVDGSAAALQAVRQALRMVDQGLRASLVLANVQAPASLYELLRVHDAQAIEAMRSLRVISLTNDRSTFSASTGKSFR